MFAIDTDLRLKKGSLGVPLFYRILQEAQHLNLITFSDFTEKERFKVKAYVYETNDATPGPIRQDSTPIGYWIQLCNHNFTLGKIYFNPKENEVGVECFIPA